MSEDVISQILERLNALEQAVFASKTASPTSKSSVINNSETGPGAGIILLFSEGFFKSKKNFKEIKEKLSDAGYHYSRQAIHGALERLSKQGGPLVALRESKNILYAERK